MRKLMATIGGAGTLCLLAVTPAAASQELGDRCVGNDTGAGWTAIVLDNSLNFPELVPNVPPEGAKVITRWRAQVGPGLAPLAQQLVALKQVEEGEDLLVGESSVETLAEGTNEFLTRIPVPEYAHIGLRGPAGTLFCDHASGHLGGIVGGTWPVGEQRKFKVETSMGVPAIAFVEPDWDGDGYGDETQDGCSDNPIFQGPCPIVTMKSGILEVRRGAILIRAELNANVWMRVLGRVEWRPRPRSKHKRAAWLDGGTQQLTAGVQATFRVPIPKAVSRRLQRISPDELLFARVTLIASGALALEGRRMEKTLTARLSGRGQPRD